MAYEQQTIYGLREVIRTVRTLEQTSKNELKKQMRSKVRPELQGVRNFIRGAKNRLEAPGSSGKPAQMFHNGRSSWGGANVGIDYGVSKYRDAIVGIKATGRNGTYGFDYGELAGVRKYPGHSARSRSESRPFMRDGEKKTIKQNGQGDAFIKMLEGRFPPGKPGRFAFRAIVKKLPDVSKKVVVVLEDWAQKVNRTLV